MRQIENKSVHLTTSYPSRLIRFLTTSLIPLTLFLIVILISNTDHAGAAGNLSVEIIAAPNLIVDSNVLSPSSYQPIVGTVIGKFCNTSASNELTNVSASIGDFAPTPTPGIYPVKTDVTMGIATTTTYDGSYSFTHLGGTADATRFIGDLAPGACNYQYWSFTYPKTATSGGSAIPAWGNSVKPEDDLSLDFDIWASGYNTGTASTDTTSQPHTMTMRNEISAMANKIKPNGNPGGVWFNTDTSSINPGDTITTNGILYRLGNINQGFDNDNDGVPDYNAWLQPFGNPSYDPSCFRLISSTGVLTITRSGGNADMIIPFDDQLYFTDLPSDNTNVIGEVFYEFLSLGGPCTIPISPYQEVASGSDNEKFNGDYGTGIPPVISFAPTVTIDKTGDATVNEGAIVSYSIPFVNTGDREAGLTLSTGGVNAPMMVSDTVPDGMEYDCGSADATLNYTPSAAPGYTIYYSTDSGATWSTSEPTCPVTSTAPNNQVMIQWWLTDPLPKNADSGSGTAVFQANVPAAYISGGGDPFIENCATGGFGDGDPFGEACATTMVLGTNSIGDYVYNDANSNGRWDEDGSGTLNAGDDDGINNITVTLYWDKNGNGALDDDDMLIDTAVTANDGSNDGAYLFSQLPDGDYLVVVDTADADLPVGYGPTTAHVHAASPSGGVFYSLADFGFGPSLRLNKTLISDNPINETETVAYTIQLQNMLPGDGTNQGFCVYDVWTGATTTGGNNQDFLAIENATGVPDGLYSTGDYSTGGNRFLVGADYASSGRSSAITKVEAIYSGYMTELIDDDTLDLELHDGIGLFASINVPTTELNNFAPGPANQGLFIWDVTANAPGGSWEWSDFDAVLESHVLMNKNAAPETSEMDLDAFGFRVTTDDTSCGGADTTILVLPLTDTYDADLLEFVSADPTVTSATTGGTEPNDGTLTWSNLGPLYGGGVQEVTVVFKALDPSADSATTTNNANSTNAEFGNGRLVNDAADTADVTINATGSIAGVVWSDVAGGTTGWDGSTGYDGGDAFLKDVTVTLNGCYDNDPASGGILITAPTTTKSCDAQGPTDNWFAIATQTTGSDGAYLFEGLGEGFYYTAVTAGLPAGATQSGEPVHNLANNGRTCVTCDNTWVPAADTAATANLNTTNFNPIGTGGDSPNESIANVNFGYGGVPAAIYGKVFTDSNGDGSQDSGEADLSGITVRLCADTACASVIDTASTAADGSYSFDTTGPMTPGTYYVVVTPPAGTNQTADPDEAGACTTCDNHTTTPITVAAGETKGSYDFGYQPAGTYTIGDYVYVDWNGDGSKAANEEGIPNITVSLYEDDNGDGVIDAEDGLIATTATNAAGYYAFLNQPADNFIVVVNEGDADFPSGHAATGDPDEAGTCTVCDGQGQADTTTPSNDLNADFGYQPQGFGSIGDYVWFDIDADTIQDATESSAKSVAVTLYHDVNGDGLIDAADAVVATTTTDANGLYAFTDLVAADYIVQIDAANFAAGQPLYGRLLTDSAAAYNATQNSYKVALGAGETFSDADFGFANSAIGDLIWQDNDGDGTRDPGEPGIANVTVNLFVDANNNGVLDAGAESVTIATAVTDSDGHYYFGSLSPGNYVVKVDTGSPALANHTLTGDPDSYNTSDPINLSCTHADAVACDNAKFFDNLDSSSPYDLNPGLALGQTDLTADFGYQPQGVIGDTVWIDSDNDGQRDGSEQGIPDITVKLCSDAACTAVLDTTTTDENGEYSFGGLTDGLTYYVQVDTGDADFPTGLSQTHDPDTTMDDTGSYTVDTGVNNGVYLDMDFGYRFAGSNSVTGTVWHDTNSGGQTGGAGDMAGETIRYKDVPIYLWNCGAGTCADGDETMVGSTFTAPDGAYAFTGLADGQYRVIVNPSALSLRGTTPTTTTDYDGAPVTDPTAVLTGGNTAVRDFGFLSQVDLGDLPAAYNVTTLANNGARHLISPNLYLGASTPDTNADGPESANADGDGADDSDGVIYQPSAASSMGWTVGTVAGTGDGGSLQITIGGGWSGVPQVFFDFDGDDATFALSKVVLRDSAGNPLTMPLAPGVHRVYFDVPTGAFDNATNPMFLRVRLSTDGGLGATGLALNGEVEDYRMAFGPTAVSLQNIQAGNGTTPIAAIILAGLMLMFTSAVIVQRRRIRA